MKSDAAAQNPVEIQTDWWLFMLVMSVTWHHWAERLSIFG